MLSTSTRAVSLSTRKVCATPAGLERLYRDAGVPATALTLQPGDTARPATEELQRIFAANGVVNVGPPLGPGD